MLRSLRELPNREPFYRKQPFGPSGSLTPVCKLHPHCRSLVSP